MSGGDGARGSQAVELAHRDVHQHDVRPVGLVRGERVSAVGAFGDVVRQRRQQSGDELPDCGGVVHDEDPHAIAGTTATYHFTETHSTAGLVFDAASCGLYGQVTSSVSGSSITCRFNDVPEPVTTDVAITIYAAGGTGSSNLPVLVEPDLTPPVLTLPATIHVNSTSNTGANVSFNVSAVDAVSGPSQFIICNATSGARFPIGTTTVSCSASDWTGNVANGGFDIVVTDVTPPSLTLPTSPTLDATSPAGAVATFTATAADAVPVSPLVSCVPPSGSTFKIGATSVACSTADTAGNQASGQFTITVRGAADQIKTLQAYIGGLSIDATLQKQLLTALKAAATSVAAGRRSACAHLTTVATLATNARGTTLTVEQADRIVSDVMRIRSVLGC
jgi:hypothetical protein